MLLSLPLRRGSATFLMPCEFLADRASMRHVKDIQKIVDHGDSSEAHVALDELLDLGPNNIDALKLKARLYRYEGRFEKEVATWNQIISIDREDPDAIGYFLQKQIEDREFFYFTDAHSSGDGRRFLAYPRDMLSMVTFGLMGCMLFLISNKLTVVYAGLADPSILLGFLFLFVLLPWVFIIISYFKSLRYVGLSSKGLEIVTRVRTVKLLWQDVEKVFLVHGAPGENFGLSLVFLLKDRERPSVEIDINPATSVLRALPYFVKEVKKFFGEPTFIGNEDPVMDEALSGKKCITY